MAELATEAHHDLAKGLDTLAPREILSILHQGQIDAANAVAMASRDIAKASDLLFKTLNGGGNIIYAAAGSSALMALADGAELPGTFGIDKSRLKILIAGGLDGISDLVGITEDDADRAGDDIRSANVSNKDCLICVSASGTTPYTIGALEAAKKAGAKIISIANNDNCPLLKKADIAVYLPTPSEIIAGSTRMGAATAQKIALNMISTLLAVHLGHIHDGYMINVRADNAKLRARAQSMVMAISNCSKPSADEYLEKSNGSVKLAVLMAAGSPDEASAKIILDQNDQKLRLSVSVLNRGSGSNLQSA